MQPAAGGGNVSGEQPADPAWQPPQELAGRYNLHAKRLLQIGRVRILGQGHWRSRR
jgi:hypothetical protein